MFVADGLAKVAEVLFQRLGAWGTDPSAGCPGEQRAAVPGAPAPATPDAFTESTTTWSPIIGRRTPIARRLANTCTRDRRFVPAPQRARTARRARHGPRQRCWHVARERVNTPIEPRRACAGNDGSPGPRSLSAGVSTTPLSPPRRAISFQAVPPAAGCGSPSARCPRPLPRTSVKTHVGVIATPTSITSHLPAASLGRRRQQRRLPRARPSRPSTTEGSAGNAPARAYSRRNPADASVNRRDWVIVTPKMPRQPDTDSMSTFGPGWAGCGWCVTRRSERSASAPGRRRPPFTNRSQTTIRFETSRHVEGFDDASAAAGRPPPGSSSSIASAA